MDLIKKYLHSKWTALEKVNWWRHFEVKNVLLKTQELEVFSICDKSIIVKVKFSQIENKKNGLEGGLNYNIFTSIFKNP